MLQKLVRLYLLQTSIKKKKKKKADFGPRAQMINNGKFPNPTTYKMLQC